ncbi:uncharacterized protein LOC126370809 [Pectinophora gossypiella]|uniref:uncharacterized protein LOC126370809 n=1 Tax=Pectinophora gossypiella TaxID=13191 RepID=UPI00214E060C|nr:uncharacterized protein LOC126370809 [Pectinophora gossypiella]
MTKPPKRKKGKPPPSQTSGAEESTDSDSTERGSNSNETQQDKYTPYRVIDYNRRYPEDSAAGSEFVVFIESTDPNKTIGSRDMMYLNNCFVRSIKGIKYLKKVNKYKMGVVFDRPNMANAFLENTTFLRDQCLKASIPAGSTELTGVITGVPAEMSNYQVFKALESSSKKIICVRRILKKQKVDEGFKLEPTQTVTITFASSTCLPDYVFIKMWRLPVLPYIPPVKQCFNCLRYGHMAKFCKNAQRCSICSDKHSFRECQVPAEKAVCAHCQGNHISISGECPVKKLKIAENKNKYTKAKFSDLFNAQNFPSLNKAEQTKNLLDLFMSDKTILNLITETIIKVIHLNKTQNTNINSKTITDTIKETFEFKNKNNQNSQIKS